MKLWKQRQQGKAGSGSNEQAATGTSTNDSFRQLHLRRSSSNQQGPIVKSTSRTSLDIQGRFTNFIQKSSSTTGLDLANVNNSHKDTASRRFPRPRTASTSSISGPSGSPSRLIQQPRKWVSNLLHSGAAGNEQLETTAQARKRASVDLSRPTPAFVSSLVLSSNDNETSQLNSRPLYTLESGLQRGARPASVYSSHLSSASRSNPELHRGSVTRHLDNGAMAMDIAPTLASLATTSSRIEVGGPSASRLAVRNAVAGSPDSSTVSFPLPSHIVRNLGSSHRTDVLTTHDPSNRSEEEDQIDVSIARDRTEKLLGREEQAVLDMLDSMSPSQSMDLNTPTQAISLADIRPATRLTSDKPVMSPKISALLQSLSIDTDTKGGRQNSAPVRNTPSDSAFASRQRSQGSSPTKTVNRVPVPAIDSMDSLNFTKSLSPGKSTLSATKQTDIPSSGNSSLPSSSALTTNAWSRPLQSPDTPSSSQEPYSPLRSASSVPSKWSASNSYFNLNQVGKNPSNRPTYGLQHVSSPVEQTNADNGVAREPPQLHRHTTDFTVASSVSDGQASSRAENAHKVSQADQIQPVSDVSRNSSTRSTGSSLAAIKSELEKAASGISCNDRPGSVRSVAGSTTSRPATPSKIVLPASPTKAKDLIKMFETSSATASPSEQSAFFSPANTPRRNLSPSKELDAKGTSKTTPKRYTPLALSISKSNFSATSPASQGYVSATGSPIDVKAEWNPPFGSDVLGDATIDKTKRDSIDDLENAAPSAVFSSMSHNRSQSVKAAASLPAPGDTRRLSTPTKAGVSGASHRVSGFLKPTQASSLLTRRLGAQSDQEDRASTASAATEGSVASYRHQKEEGDLPLINTTAILMAGEPPGSKPVRAGALLYFNVHDENPRWLSVNATLLPAAIAMSWIPAGGGRENVVLDLASCREVHSVPSPDHPSSVSDVGAVSARRQSLDNISPFQLIFDDGVERLAADSVKSRMQWVASFKEVTGTASPRYGSVAESFTVNSGHKPSFGQAMSNTGSVPPPLPPKDSQNISASPLRSKVASSPFMTSSTASAGQVRAKVQDWQRAEGDKDEGVVYNMAPRSPALTNSLAGLIRQFPGSHTDVKSNWGSMAETPANIQASFAREQLVRTDSLPVESPADLDGYESALSHNSVSDEFGPRTPASEVVFNWDRLDKDSDLEPSDSASQRPARSEYGTIRSTLSHEYTPSARIRSDKEATPYAAVHGTDGFGPADRTPAQVLRDSVVGAPPNVAVPIIISDEDEADRSDRLGTVVEETSSQARSASVYNSFRTSSGHGAPVIEYRAIPAPVKSSAIKSNVSLTSGSSFNSQDVGRLLEYLDARPSDKVAGDSRLETQVRQFQHAVSELQDKGSLRRAVKTKRRNSDGSLGGESLVSARSYHASELSALQEKLDRVLDLVTRAVADPQPKHFRGHSESASIVMADADADNAETARVEAILAKILHKMQRSEDSLRVSAERKTHEDATPRGLLPMVSMLNVSSAGGTAGSVAATDVSGYSRMTPRSWTSERGIPSPPPNSEWELRSTSSLPVQDPTAGHAVVGRSPIQDMRMLGDTNLPSTTPRQVLIGSERSCGSVDMEVEVRKRRAHQRESSGASVPPAQAGGWYTLKGDEGLAAESGPASTPALDKPVPPTPSVRWAMDDAPAVPGTKDDPIRSESLATDDHDRNAGEAQSTSALPGDLESVLRSLKQNEIARHVEMRQQTEISRYLNELNVWLEKDVADRSKEWKSMAHGVTQLHEELKALKQGIVLPSTTSDAASVPGAPPVITVSGASDVGKDAPDERQLSNAATATSPSKRGSLPPIPKGSGKSVAFADTVTVAGSEHAKGTPVNQPVDKSKWIHNEIPTVFGNIRTAAKPSERSVKDKPAESKPKPSVEGAALVRSALCELDKFKMVQRSQGKPETPLPEEAKGDAAAAAKLPLPDAMWTKVKDAADKNDHTAVASSIRECASGGYGPQAVVKLADHVESKAKEDDSAAKEDDKKPKEEDGVHSMQTPVPRSYKAKEKEAEAAPAKEADMTTADVRDSEPSQSTLASAVEEILKHLLEQKKLQAEAEAERKAAEEAREQALIAFKEQEKAELVNMLYAKISEAKTAEDAARDAKAKEMDPKTAIELLVEAINNQKVDEMKSQQAADVAIRQMTSELLKSTTEQNQKMVEAVNAASRDMLRSNVQMHAEEFKRILHKEVTSMFEDVGKIREAKRHLEFEIADLWSIKSRHLQQAGTSGLPITYSVPGEFPAGHGSQPKPFPQPAPRAQIQHSQPAPYPPGNIQPIPTAAASPPKPVKAEPPAAPAPKPAATPASPGPVQTLGNISPSKRHQFNFGPRQPLYR